MKIIYIGNKLSKYGATPTTIDVLSELFVQEGWEVVVASDLKNQYLRFLDMVGTVIRNPNADYVIIDTYSTKAFWFGFVISQLCRWLSLPFIPFLHGGDLPQRLVNSPRCSQLFFRPAHQCVAPSQYLKKAFEDAGYSNLTFIPNILELDQYPLVKKNYDSPRLLWVRSFASLYQPKLAIEVLQRLKRTHPKSTLCMVGPDKDGSLSATQTYAQQLGLEVDFTGKLSKADWIEKAAHYNIFINTTTIDNTPVSVMEAMALGMPVVSTNVGGIPYLIADRFDGLLVAPNDADAMANAVTQILENQQLQETLTQNALTKAKSWDWNVVKKQWKVLFS